METKVEISHFWKKNQLEESHMKILKLVGKKVQWRMNKLKSLLARIQKIGRNATNFTVREAKLLRKLINQQKKDGYTDFKVVADDFPGKSIKTLKNKYYKK